METTSRAPRRSPQSWEATIEAFENSGLSQSAFCRQSGIKPSSLHRWLSRLRPRHDDPAPLIRAERPHFVEIELPAPAPAALMRVQVGELTVEFDTLVPPAWVAELAALREARRC